MNKADAIFKKNIMMILTHGVKDENPRPKYASDGKPAHSIFITQVFEEYDLHKGELPITTLRPIAIKNGIKEIQWIYQDQTNDLDILEDKYGIKWWREWDVGDGTIGQRYGATVGRYQMVNNLITGLKNNPYGRRHMMNLWQEKDLEETEGLPPCAFQTMWSIRPSEIYENGERQYFLDCTLIQRSSDYLVAGHINMIQYVSLQMMIVQELNMWARVPKYKVGKFARFTQNLHIYDRHIEQAHELLNRIPYAEKPKLILNAEGKGFYEIEADDFELINYHPIKPQLKFDLGI